MGAVVVTLYTKPDCCLCVEAKRAIAQARACIPFTLDEVDITAHPRLLARYGERIPFVFVAGRPAFKYRVDPRALAARVRAATTRAH